MLCPSTCRKLLVDMHPCCHSMWIHISEALLWPFQLMSVYMGKCQPSEQRWMCYLTERPSDSLLLHKKRKERRKEKHFRSQGKCPHCCENMCKNKQWNVLTGSEFQTGFRVTKNNNNTWHNLKKQNLYFSSFKFWMNCSNFSAILNT